MAWDEWEQLKTDTADQRSHRMQLNQVPPEPGGGGGSRQGDLAVNQTDLAAIGDAAFELRQDFGRVSEHARAASQKAAGGLKTQGFALGGALDHVASRWIDQSRSLLDATAHISNHLDFTKGAHAGDEVHIAGTVSSIATLDAGFNERKGA
ncbi:hypothetical protein ACIA71_27545 [Streptomyces anulatus]|uniref:hypothetical protein n=1 Tax=Streptomyces anulatus TaxID=1892 RepID=UPI001C5DF14D|nr:hypothetical protein [Streptomyces anulatus]QYA94519.1 hypothetical protein KZO11_12820 [Streptomyces anulatus]WSW83209.1 hypothetical protein OG536_13405 [Streptomyces anulatus]